MSYTAIMHVYNDEKTLETVLKSIQKQTKPPEGIYIVDDGSTDETPEIIHNRNIPHTHLNQNPNLAPHLRRANAFNEAKEKASKTYPIADYLLKVDGDIEIEPEYTETLLTHMKNPWMAACSGKSTEYDKTRDLNNGAVLYRKTTLPRAQQVYGWDLAIQIELIRKGYMITVDPTVYYKDLRPPKTLRPPIKRVIKNRVTRQIAELEGSIRRQIT